MLAKIHNQNPNSQIGTIKTTKIKPIVKVPQETKRGAGNYLRKFAERENDRNWAMRSVSFFLQCCSRGLPSESPLE